MLEKHLWQFIPEDYFTFINDKEKNTRRNHYKVILSDLWIKQFLSWARLDHLFPYLNFSKYKQKKRDRSLSAFLGGVSFHSIILANIRNFTQRKTNYFYLFSLDSSRNIYRSRNIIVWIKKSYLDYELSIFNQYIFFNISVFSIDRNRSISVT